MPLRRSFAVIGFTAGILELLAFAHWGLGSIAATAILTGFTVAVGVRESRAAAVLGLLGFAAGAAIYLGASIHSIPWIVGILYPAAPLALAVAAITSEEHGALTTLAAALAGAAAALWLYAAAVQAYFLVATRAISVTDLLVVLWRSAAGWSGLRISVLLQAASLILLSMAAAIAARRAASGRVSAPP